MSAFTKMGPDAATSALGSAQAQPGALRVEDVHAAHADFVFRSLARLGVRDADLGDMLQEVFVVVHRRLGSFDGNSKLTSWLFGICLRVAASYRRRAHRRYERPLDADATQLPQDAGIPSPEQAAEAAEARAKLEAVLDAMPLDKRAVLVMYEIDGLSCHEIASTLEVPIGTVHSRLHAARAAFLAALKRHDARRAGRRP
jgi:RNA polymerase sigma-70 factor (ECF subfamily)